MELLKELLVPFATAFLGGFAGWFFKRHRLEREDRQLEKTTEAQEITNLGAAMGTWQKLVTALDEQVIKLLAQRKEDSRRIMELTQEVYSLRRQVDRLQQELHRNQGMGVPPEVSVPVESHASGSRPAGVPPGSRPAVPLAPVPLLLLSLLTVLSGCRPVQSLSGCQERGTTMEMARHVRDSVTLYVSDSVLIRERGDTVYVAHWRTRWRDRYLTRRDTFRLTDSIYVERAVPVGRALSRWQAFQIWCGRLALILSAVYLAVKAAGRRVRPFRFF